VSAATRTLAETVREAHAALRIALELPWRERKTMKAEIIDLAAALDEYKKLDPAAMLWEAGFTAFAGEADPDGAKLIAAAEQVETKAGALIAAMAAKSGTENDETSKTETAGVAS
jgi:hypothetical protein